MKCDNCGSIYLIWDYKNGNVVCSMCGLVVESIYEGQYMQSQEDIIIISNNINIKLITKKYLKILSYNKIFKNNYININNKIKFYSKEAEIALDFLSRNNKVKLIYEKLNNTGVFSGKKIKTRVAISYYLAGYRGKELENVLNILKINKKYFKKYLNKILRKLNFEII
jgi:transcription initiation factor TFIIIB Brf1 subunit/transcription initiation factor TFIIB